MSTSGSGNADSGGVESTPTDIDDDVRADLEAAFSRDTGRLRIKDETSSHATGDATVDVVSPFEQPIEPSRDSPVEPVATSQRKGRFGRRRRRSILEIARDYDTRVKSRADGPAVDARIHEPDDAPRDVSPDDSPADPSSDGELPAVGGKKRVVITDDTVDAARESHDRRRAG
ncbi:MAG: hypothetical protein ACKOA6_07135, partial [Actinomycetota bacterium]